MTETTLRQIFAALTFAMIATVVPAQSPPVGDQADPREFSEAGRKAYAGELKVARGLIAERKYDAAIVALDKLIAERLREPQARFLKGVALTDAGQDDAAVAMFQAVLGDFPELPEPQNNLAVIYARKGNYGLARDALEAAIRASPDYVIAYENLGDIYARLAAQNYEMAIARDARNRTAPVKLKFVRDALSPPAASAAMPAASASVGTVPAPAITPATATTGTMPPPAAPR